MGNKLRKNLYVTKEENDLIIKKAEELGVSQNDFIKNCIYYFDCSNNLIISPEEEITEIKELHKNMEEVYKKLIRLCVKTLNMERIRAKYQMRCCPKKFRTSCNDYMLDQIYKIQNEEEKNKELVDYFIGMDIQ